MRVVACACEKVAEPRPTPDVALRQIRYDEIGLLLAFFLKIPFPLRVRHSMRGSCRFHAPACIYRSPCAAAALALVEVTTCPAVSVDAGTATFSKRFFTDVSGTTRLSRWTQRGLACLSR